MKTLLTVTILVGGSLASAQIPTANKQTSFGNTPSFQRKGLLGERKSPEKRQLLDLVAPNKSEDNLSSLQNRQKLMDSLKTARGTEGVGGGNGVQSSDGKITPLDVVFAQENKVIDVKKEYSVGYGYFQEQVNKISKALPSFASDIETRFANLTWIASGLELSASKECLNNMGIFQVRVGEKQVVLACQNSEGEVSLNARAIKKLKDPRYLGVIFLHEAFVRSMLHEYRSDEYSRAEFQMISKVVPYIISNQILNPGQLYEYAQIVRYIQDKNYFNDYALEAFEDRRASYKKDQDKKDILEERTSKLRLDTEKLFQLRQTLACDGSNVEPYIIAYGSLINAYRLSIEANEAYYRSSANGKNSAEIEAMNEIVIRELDQIQKDHESTMSSLISNCQN